MNFLTNLAISPSSGAFFAICRPGFSDGEMSVTKVYEARYIDPEQLRSMLTRLFPGKWAAEVCEPADCRGVLALTLSALQTRLVRLAVRSRYSLRPRPDDPLDTR